MPRPRRIALALVVAALFLVAGFAVYIRVWPHVRTIADVMRQHGATARAHYAPFFKRAGVAYPPRKLAILIFKTERRLALWAAGDDDRWRYIRDYPILAASGTVGPKRREGDFQVPEGLYGIEYLNPMSSYDLSMKVSYPNAYDRLIAAREHRTRLGGDIFIHGKNLSIGCVAIGDPAIEELFPLVAATGPERTRVIIAPVDLRVTPAPVADSTPLWVVKLWQAVENALREFPVEAEANRFFDVRGMRKESKVLPVH